MQEGMLFSTIDDLVSIKAEYPSPLTSARQSRVKCMKTLCPSSCIVMPRPHNVSRPSTCVYPSCRETQHMRLLTNAAGTLERYAAWSYNLHL